MFANPVSSARRFSSMMHKTVYWLILCPSCDLITKRFSTCGPHLHGLLVFQVNYSVFQAYQFSHPIYCYQYLAHIIEQCSQYLPIILGLDSVVNLILFCHHNMFIFDTLIWLLDHSQLYFQVLLKLIFHHLFSS